MASTTARRTRGRRIGTIAIIGAGVTLVMALVGTRAFPPSVGRYLAWPGYLWLAAMFYLLITLLALEIPTLIARFVLKRRARGMAVDPSGAPGAAKPELGLARKRPAPEATDGGSQPDGRRIEPGGDPGDRVDQGRRLLLFRSAALVAGVTAVGAVGVGIPTALGAPERRRISVRLPKLPGDLDGFTIAVASDIHLGPLLGRSHVERVVETLNDFDADVIAIVGDLVDGSVAELGSAAEPLRGLRARLGSFFVTGNHEYFSGYKDWIAKVSGLGVRVLRNERVGLGGIDLAGINDATGEMYGDPADLKRALAGRDRSRPVVLLAHQPAQAPLAARLGVDLQISGHTHGGQMWPFSLAVAADQPVTEGLSGVDGMPVYVSKGAGFWGPPVRVGAPPDVTLITLRAPLT